MFVYYFEFAATEIISNHQITQMTTRQEFAKFAIAKNA